MTTTATVKGSTATFPAALTGGRDVSVTMQPDGFEESVILSNNAAASSYIDTITLPRGLTARPGIGQTGVEFVDAAGTVVATFGGGSYSGGGDYSAGYSRTRTFLYFPLNLPTDANYQVTSATLTMTVRQSCANLTSCTPSGYVYAGGLATSWNQASVDWANQPTPDAYAYADDKYVVYAGQGINFNVASLAQRWMTGQEANNGLELIAAGAEHSLNVFQNYYPSESGVQRTDPYHQLLREVLQPGD